jgi:hypothetical protein
MRILSNGNVGIGASDPKQDLHVHNAGYTTAIQLSNDNSGYQISNGLSLGFQYLNDSDVNSYAYLINRENTKLGLGTDNSIDIMIYSGGNVAIGSVEPDAKLDIDGQIKIRGGNPGYGKVLTSNSSGLASWVTPGTGFWTQYDNDIYSNNSGNVGIGTTEPDYKLDVLGNRIRLIDDTDDWIALRTDGSTDFLDITYSGGHLAVQGDADDENIILTPSRNSKVGIRNWVPAYTLDVNGDIRATGSVYYGGTVGNADGTPYIKPDFVFKDDYKILSTDDVEKFVKRKNHLPWMTSAQKEQKEHKDVINLTRMQFESLETIENLQLQIIELNNKIKELGKMLDKQQREIDKLQAKK